MEKINFIPEKLYYLESKENPEDVILDVNNHSKFKNLNLDWDSNVQSIKNRLTTILEKQPEYGNACLDFIDSKNEKQLLKTSFLDLTLHYDYNVFKNIIIVTGLEMNNL